MLLLSCRISSGDVWQESEHEHTNNDEKEQTGEWGIRSSAYEKSFPSAPGGATVPADRGTDCRTDHRKPVHTAGNYAQSSGYSNAG